MLEGEIIKFYRERANMTQAQLGEGICTTTHVSKIERGKTAYSDEIIELFSERLAIDIKREIESIGDIDKLLQQFHRAIIMGRQELIEETRNELEATAFIQSTYYAAHYYLLIARYYIFYQKNKKAWQILEHVEKTYTDLTPYEKNLFLHTMGIYYISDRVNYMQESQPILFLKEVNMDDYGNQEYYYHLAIAYHLIGSYIMSYFYAEKALRYFKETNNYARSINAESVMLLQMSRDRFIDFNELVERYENLIRDSDLLGLQDRKAILLNNLGFEYFNRGEYALSKKCHQEALLLDDPTTSSYLLHLCNYVDTCLEGNLSKRNVLLKKIKEGLSLAKTFKSTHFQILFQLMKLKAEKDYDAYYQFIEEKALPQFSSSKHVIYLKRYEKLLFNHYVETDQYVKATQILANQM